jgi:pimeloyl-ACP methyl ester carboxylesterase
VPKPKLAGGQCLIIIGTEGGFTDSAESWYELGYVHALQVKHRLILIDSRGHGQSDKPHDLEAYTPDKFASDVTAVLDDVGLKSTAFWGYSQGG